MRLILLSMFAITSLIACKKASTPTPQNVPTVSICNQVWMTKNLDVSVYRNGDAIPQVTDSAQWVNLTTGAWCYYNNDPANGAIYGKLYNWYAVNDPRGLAPTGYHVSTDSEWSSLVTCLGGDSTAGGKIKEAGIMHWLSPNTAATNSSGIKGLPAGCRDFDGSFNYISSYGIWWSSTEDDTTYSWARDLYYNDGVILRFNDLKILGFSVRCLKD
ncbi:MAG: fibrobacter succinogenes major paralogous domain-containing protein [Bacteroidota bacterium]